jgi:hypothetical protein
MENKMQEHPPITLDMVNWRPSYRLSKASIGQIMKSFEKIQKVKPKNTYEDILYGKLKSSVTILLSSYNELLVSTNDVEYNIRFHNLIVDLPYNVTINENEHNNIYLGTARIGALIEAAKQRLEFIINRPVPTICQATPQLEQEFVKLKTLITDFRDVLMDFEEAFIEAIDYAHKHKTISPTPKKVLEQGNNTKNNTHQDQPIAT